MPHCRTRSRTWTALVVAVLWSLTTGETSFAQVTGKIVGTITNLETGSPLVGAQITVEGTRLGNVSDPDGTYFINNSPVGVRTITASYLGYQTVSIKRRIFAGQTMTVDFSLSSMVVEATPILVAIEAVPLVIRDNTISKSRFTGEEARSLPVDELREVVELGAGVYFFERTSGVEKGLVIRGGRATESAVFVDGVLITDFATQAFADVGRFAVEEVDVITGGFNAEFGHAQSGVVNIVTRDGGSEFHGAIRYTTDGRYGTDGYSEPSELGLRFDPISGSWDRVGDPKREECCGYNSLQASVGGPIVPDRLTGFASLDIEGAADFFPRSAGFNPAEMRFNSGGSTNTVLPDNRGDRTRAQFKLTSFITDQARLTGTYLFGRDQFEDFRLGHGPLQWLNDTASRTKTHDVILSWDQRLLKTEEREIGIQVRANWHQTKFNEGTPLNRFSATFLANDEEFMATCGRFCAEVDKALRQKDAFADDFLNYRFGDVEFFFEDALPHPLEADLLQVPAPRAVSADPIFGQPQSITNSGVSNDRRSRDERRYGLRVDVDAQLNRVHRFKFGGEFTWIDLEDRDGIGGFRRNLYEVDPRVGALYVQDRMDVGDLVIDLGLRMDTWDPNTRFPRFPGVVPCEIASAPELGCQDPASNPLATAVRPDRKVELAPRFGVAHPITDQTQVRLSYGRFYQLPELRRFFENFLVDNPFGRIGNPELDYVETTALEMGLTHLMNEDLVLDVVAYNRDRRGAIRFDIFQRDQIVEGLLARIVATNADNGNVKGVDITLAKRYSDYWSMDLAWSLQWARGTSSSPVEACCLRGFGQIFSEETAGVVLTGPTELSAESFDRLYTINAQLLLRFPADFVHDLWLTPFNDFGVSLVHNAHSGEPYTRFSLATGTPVEDPKKSRLPWVHQTKVRITRALQLGDGLDVELFASAINVFDVVNVLTVIPTTGRPDSDGLEETLSQTPTIPSPFRTDGSTPTDFPVALEDLQAESRDEFAQQDFDGDGAITLEEAQLALRNEIQSGADWVRHYGEPRQWRFGAEIRF